MEKLKIKDLVASQSSLLGISLFLQKFQNFSVFDTEESVLGHRSKQT